MLRMRGFIFLLHSIGLEKEDIVYKKRLTVDLLMAR